MASTGERPAIWTQLVVQRAEAERLATEAGLPDGRNRCISRSSMRAWGSGGRSASCLVENGCERRFRMRLERKS